MKRSGYNKVLGLALSEQSMLIAEVTGADKPEVKRLVEFAFPPGLTLADPGKLGAALSEFLKAEGISTKSAVVGLPARWLVVKSKDVPPTDTATLTDLLRLQAEGEFSTELKDLVYDYVGQADPQSARSVLLVATQRKHVDAASELCAAAKLSAVAVTSSAVALGMITGRSASVDAMVLAVTPAGAELTAHHGLFPNAIRHLRTGATERAFMGELRRAVSTVPSNGSAREIILWDSTGLNPTVLSEGINLPVRSVDLDSLGTVESGNGENRQYAAAVAVAMSAISDRSPALDFLHSRLAAAEKRRVAPWVIYSVIAVLLLVGLGVWAQRDLNAKETELRDLQATLDSQTEAIKSAKTFVSKVTFAQGWLHTDPRYLACLRDLTSGIPEDGQTYATNLTLREENKTIAGGKQVPTGLLSGQLYGKSTDLQRVQFAIDGLRKNRSFIEVKLGGTQDAGKGREVSFSILFTYRPAVTNPTATTQLLNRQER